MRDDTLVIPTLGGQIADEVLTHIFTPTLQPLPQGAANGTNAQSAEAYPIVKTKKSQN